MNKFMLYTNINIVNNSNQFKHVIEYIQQNNLVSSGVEYLDGVSLDCNIDDNIEDYVLFLQPKNTQYIKHYNHWHVVKTDVTFKRNEINEHDEMVETVIICNPRIDEYVPNTYNMSTIRLYFPQFSMDAFHQGHSYALTINTWICGRPVILGNYIINRCDTLACSKVKTFFNEEYFEYIDFPIIDPYSLIYSDDWKEWRQNICGESLNIDTVNSVGSILQCSLHPVEITDDNYMKVLSEFVGGQNFINLTSNSNDFLNLNISPNINRRLGVDERPAIEFQLCFNKYYDGSLKEYLDETYGIRDYKIKYELVIGNSDDIYAVCTSPDLDLITFYKFDKDEINEYNFDSGYGWKTGISIKGSVNILDENNESVLYLLSNEIPLTENIFKYLVKSDFIDMRGCIINSVNLESVNMNILNINAVNKIENKIVKIEKPGDNKSNILQTTFYRVTDSSSIIIRPEINENVCINLDQYKHLVDSFVIQIEGVKFIEIGRIKAGVIFKIIGNKLPRKNLSGQYYILNQDADLVTSGKYIYEI